MAVPILYSFRRCPYAMRARLALWASGVRVELREVKLAAKPQAMLDISPKGTVPVLQLPDGQVLEESLDIMRWALGQKDPRNWLVRDEPEWIAENDGPFKFHLDRYKYPERHKSDALEHRAEAVSILRRWDDRLGSGQGASDSDWGLSDAAILPFVRQFASVDPYWFEGLDIPHVQTWLAKFLEGTLFAAIMLRYKPWAEGDAPIYFEGAGAF